MIENVLNPVALTTTGLIWARYSTQIIPYNMSLLVVNLFVAGTGLYQVGRLAKYVIAVVSSSIETLGIIMSRSKLLNDNQCVE